MILRRKLNESMNIKENSLPEELLYLVINHMLELESEFRMDTADFDYASEDEPYLVNANRSTMKFSKSYIDPKDQKQFLRKYSPIRLDDAILVYKNSRGQYLGKSKRTYPSDISKALMIDAYSINNLEAYIKKMLISIKTFSPYLVSLSIYLDFQGTKLVIDKIQVRKETLYKIKGGR